MRNKKLVSTVVASALVATTMAMPVMAADGGKVEVDVTTKDAIIRVAVPTALAVAVDQFEKVDAGSQIYSEDFTIENKSDVPVKVDVTSKATIASVNPVTSTSAAKRSTGDDAWLAVAAETADDTYGTGIAALTDASANVTTFKKETATEAKAAQTFYLNKGATSGNEVYNLLDVKNAATLEAAKQISYARIYELTTETISGADLTAQNAALQALVDQKDVYEATSSTATTLTLIGKGSTGVTYNSSSTYYTAGTAVATLPDTFATAAKYVYAEYSVAGDKTAFRYIGKLSDGKTTWSDTDISDIEIKYDIVGVTGSNYPQFATDCNYGLYKKEKIEPQISVSDAGLITVSGLTAEKNYKSMSISVAGETYDIGQSPVTWSNDGWDKNEGGTIIGQLGSGWMGLLKGKTTPLPTLNLTLSDDTTMAYQFTIPED